MLESPFDIVETNEKHSSEKSKASFKTYDGSHHQLAFGKLKHMKGCGKAT